MNSFFLKLWYNPRFRWLAYLLFPLSLVFYFIILIRKKCYSFGILKTHGAAIPICVVGNITVGGTGKTPVVIALAEHFRKKGLRVGIIARGMGRYSGRFPLAVTAEMDADIAGDETLLLAKRNIAPIFIHKNRVLALNALLAHHECDCVISDDGLQHYALPRTQEIILIDGARGLGNRLLLPAGPLREPASKLKEAKWILSKGKPFLNAMVFSIKPLQFRSVVYPKKIYPLNYFASKNVVAIAGIAHPELFFQQLIDLHIQIEPHIFDDHARFTAHDFSKMENKMILMTEKDAVKCQSFQNENMFYLEIAAQIPDSVLEAITVDLLKSHS